MANRILVIGDTHGRSLLVSSGGDVWRGGKPLPKSVTTTGYFRVSGKSERDRLVHRLVARAFLCNWDPKLEVDHINGDKLDNRASNLRMVSKSGNACGYQKERGGSSNYRGVSYRRDRNKWTAYVNKNGTRHRVGCFDTEVEAAKARDKKAVELNHYNQSLNTYEK